MAECNLNCSSVAECKKCLQAKRIFEGESCPLSYNEDDDWFNDEDEEFSFDESNEWFEKAFVAGMKEREEMQTGYRYAKQRQLDEAFQKLQDAVEECLDKENHEQEK
ncbi:Hypothetical predicted protein [Paramuricea clavata]|uniref:Uncharacterized protein n=1 Tax=Paramuricea clavata TaxID=317549 RepID=A0A6S7HJI6_PARCT|nr:Hypothetical predicted protein [Paramuricea clavata]